MGIRPLSHNEGTKKGVGGVGALLGTIPPNMSIRSYTIVDGMYQECGGCVGWLRVSCPTSVLDLIPLLMGCSKNKGGGCGSRGAPLGTFSIPNVGIASGEGFMPNECIGSYRIIGWMYQESAGVRVSIPTSVLDLIPWMEDSGRAEERGRRGG